MSTNALLTAKNLRLVHGPYIAVEECSLEVIAGECVGLVGANGAGKSTTLTTLARIHPVKSGRITFDGQDITDWSAGQAVSSGLVLCPEGRHLFGEMTVEDNVLLGLTRSGLSSSGTRARLDEINDMFPKLAERRRQLAGTLSGGEQQMVALG